MSSRRILVLSFYYPPDLAAGSFRTAALVKRMAAVCSPRDEIEVVAGTPNRYSSFITPAARTEAVGNVKVTRAYTPRHRSGMLDQVFSFGVFAVQVLWHVRRKPYDLVFATTSRMFTGFLGAIIARARRTTFYLDMRDLFPDVIGEMLRGKVWRVALPLVRLAERFTIAQATVISVVSPAFEGYLRERGFKGRIAVFPNGVDDEFLTFDFSKSEASDRRIVVYAGNIGDGQGLDRIVPSAARRLANECEFWIIGDGGARARLERALAREAITNVKIVDPVPRSELLKYYKKADFLLLHLNDFDAFKKVLPSKLFEYGATGKHILAGVSGYAEEFTREHLSDGATVFSPCDTGALVDAVRRESGAFVNRDRFKRDFARTAIMSRMVDDVLAASCVGREPGCR